jgi:antitoxin component YwqK of YwqJK toxin-antitoxin module
MLKVIAIVFLIQFPFRLFSQDTLRVYYPSGKLAGWDIKLDSGKREGRLFYESGKIHAETRARINNGDTVVDYLKEYYESGITEMLKNDSELVDYQPDGTVFNSYSLKDHKKNGIACTYMGGMLWMEQEFKNDILNGYRTTYDSCGAVESREYFKEGRLEGPLKIFKKSVLTKQIFYNKGCPIKVEYFGKSGKLTRMLITKKEIWMEEGKPIGCN